MTRNLFAAIFCALLLAVYASTSWLAWESKGLSVDEPLGLVAAVLQVKQANFRLDAENPPLWKYYFVLGTPALNMELAPPPGGDSDPIPSTVGIAAYAVKVIYQTPANDAQALVNPCRARMLFLAVLLGAVIAFWSFKLAGPIAACTAAATFCLDPNFLAHGLPIKNDVPMALLFTAVMFALWRVGRAATILNCCALALLIAAALGTKFSGLLALGVVAPILVLRAGMPIDWPVLKYTARTFRAKLLAAASIIILALFVSWISIWASYDFRFAPPGGTDSDFHDALSVYGASHTPVGDNVTLDSPQDQLIKLVARWKPDRAERVVLWLNAHRLFPQSYLTGYLLAASDNAGRSSFLDGHVSLNGWWYYFPLAMLFKTPLATLIALALAVVICFVVPRKLDRWLLYVLVFPPLIYMLAAMKSGMNIGIRHILPVYPFLFIFLGIAAARAFQKFGKYAVAVLAVLLLGLAAETFAAFPDFIPFFNAAVGGARGGARLLSDSNIDWGQELPNIARWQRAHPQYQLMLSFFGCADPRYYGIRYVDLPGSFAPVDQPRDPTRTPYWAVSVIALHGEYLFAGPRAYYEPFRHRQPKQILGGCIYLYDSR